MLSQGRVQQCLHFLRGAVEVHSCAVGAPAAGAESFKAWQEDAAEPELPPARSSLLRLTTPPAAEGTGELSRRICSSCSSTGVPEQAAAPPPSAVDGSNAAPPSPAVDRPWGAGVGILMVREKRKKKKENLEPRAQSQRGLHNKAQATIPTDTRMHARTHAPGHVRESVQPKSIATVLGSAPALCAVQALPATRDFDQVLREDELSVVPLLVALVGHTELVLPGLKQLVSLLVCGEGGSGQGCVTAVRECGKAATATRPKQ